MYSMCFVQTCSINSLDTFNPCMERVRTRSLLHSNEKPCKHFRTRNAFEQEAYSIRTRSQACSNEKLNTFAQSLKRVRTKPQTLSYIIWNTFEQDPRLVCFVCTCACTCIIILVLYIHVHCVSTKVDWHCTMLRVYTTRPEIPVALHHALCKICIV